MNCQHPNDEFYLIIGGDNWANFSKWENFEDIIRNYQILVYPRFGYDTDIPGEYSGNVSIVDAPIIELSSTQIRTSLRQNQNIRFYLPDEVYDYILKNPQIHLLSLLLQTSIAALLSKPLNVKKKNLWQKC